MPDAISRSVSEAVFRWNATLPPEIVRAIADVAQYGIVLAILAIGLGALWAARGRPAERIAETVVRLLPGFVAVAAALVAAQLLGQLLPEARPFVALGQAPLVPHAADPGFPSDHVSGGMAMLGARVGPRTRALTFVIVVAVGIARVLAGIHWLDDIVGATIVGLVAGGAAAAAFSAARRKRVTPSTAAVP